jgi:hypothetical protein
LPDGIFSYQKYKFWSELEWEMLVYFIVICSILRSFGIDILWPIGNFVVVCYIFPAAWYIVSKQNLATLLLTHKMDLKTKICQYAASIGRRFSYFTATPATSLDCSMYLLHTVQNNVITIGLTIWILLSLTYS